MGVIFSLIDRALLLSYPEFHEKNIILCINMLLENGYPLQFIFDNIKKSIKKLLLSKSFTRNTEIDSERNIIVFPYIKYVSEAVSLSFKSSDIMIGYKCLNRLTKNLSDSCQ